MKGSPPFPASTFYTMLDYLSNNKLLSFLSLYKLLATGRPPGFQYS
jgi:hypothetical protein